MLAQCRCPDPNKEISVVSPCTHTTQTETYTKPITLESLHEAYDKVRVLGRVKQFKCAPETYIALKNYLLEKELEEEIQGGMKHRKPVTYFTTMMGITIFIDPEMKPGEWKFV